MATAIKIPSATHESDRIISSTYASTAFNRSETVTTNSHGERWVSTDRGNHRVALSSPPAKAWLGRSADAVAWTKVFRFIELRGPLACPAGTVQHDVCEVEQWPALRTQFGIPVEGGVDAGTDPAQPPGGCCDASGTSALPVAAIGLLIGVGIWRGRRRKRACCGRS